MTNPYVEAQRIWDDRYGSLLVAKRNWQIAWIFAACVSLALAYVVVSLSLERETEYVFVEVDRAGYAKHLSISAEKKVVPEIVLRHQLFKFISKLKTISQDAVLMKNNLEAAYKGYARSAALSFLNDYFKEHDPFDLALTKSVSVMPISVLRLTEDSWRVRWREVERSKQGYLEEVSEWEGHLVTQLEQKSSNVDELLKYNPIGLRVLEMSWTKVL